MTVGAVAAEHARFDGEQRAVMVVDRATAVVGVISGEGAARHFSRRFCAIVERATLRLAGVHGERAVTDARRAEVEDSP